MPQVGSIIGVPERPEEERAADMRTSPPPTRPITAAGNITDLVLLGDQLTVSPLQAISPEYHPASPEYIPGRDPSYPEGPADAFFAIHADGAGSSGVGESFAPSSGLTQPTVDIHGEEGGAVGLAVLPEQTPVASISAITQPVSVPSIAPPVPVPAAA